MSWKVKIARKLSAAVVLAVLIPVLGGIMLVARWLFVYEKNNYVKALNSSVMQVENNISERVGTCAQVAAMLANDRNISMFIQNRTMADSYVISEVIQNLLPKLNSARLLNKNIYHIRLLHANPKIPDVYDILYYDENIVNGVWRTTLSDMYQPRYEGTYIYQIYVSDMMEESQYFPVVKNNKEQVYAIYCPIYSDDYAQLAGLVEVLIEAEDILAACNDIQTANGEVIQFCSPQSGVVYSSEDDFFQPGEESGIFSPITQTIQWDQREYSTYANYIEALNSWMVLYVPESIVVGIYYRIAIIAAILMGILLFFLITLSVSRMISKNVQIIVTAIRQIEQGDFYARAELHSGDEWEYIAQQINSMAEKLGEFSQKIMKAYKWQKDAMFLSLENQMKPHFLCNALDFVRMSAELRNDKTTSDSIYWIMNYFNYNMGNHSSFVPIKDELANALDYINIINMIQEGNIELEIHVDASDSHLMSKYYIMKYTVQPFVENAVKHAFSSTGKEQLIMFELGIKRRDDRDRIVISIEDNGCGMDGETLARLKNSLKEDHIDNERLYRTKQGVGLFNVYNRMLMIYKTDFVFHIESFESVGTRITIEIPAWDREPEGFI